MRSNLLRKLIVDRLNTIKAQYGIEMISYKNADRSNLYPHIVFDLSSADISDESRIDYQLDIDIYATDEVVALNIADAVEDLFRSENIPTTDILPTFYLVARTEVEDTNDRDIRREFIRLNVQLYER